MRLGVIEFSGYRYLAQAKRTRCGLVRVGSSCYIEEQICCGPEFVFAVVVFCSGIKCAVYVSGMC